MHPTYAAALAVTRVALSDIDLALADLPDEAVDWAPAPGTNSATVLVRHSLTAIRFLAGTASGSKPDRQAYISGDRVEAFKASGATTASLRAEIADAIEKLPGLYEHGDETSLAAVTPWPLGDLGPQNGAFLLIHSVGHLREHAGHIGLMRDLWVAAHPAVG